MRERLVVLFAAATLCVSIADAGPRQEPETRLAPEVADRTRWQPWHAPADTPLSATQEALRADLIRHVEETVAVRRINETFPLTGDLLDGRTLWAAVVRPESFGAMVLVWERSVSGWREVARHRLGYDFGTVAPVRVEPTHAWMIAEGRSGARGLPTWEVLRFAGEAVMLDVYGGWYDIMLVDVDVDGTLEILGGESNHVNCYYCGLTSRSFGLYRWNGAEMAEVAFETLPPGSAPEAVVAANNQAAELAGAGRWTEALAVVDGARPLLDESAVFRRNASLIDLTAGAPGRLAPDTLLHYVLAGEWADAVDIFRHQPALPDFFANPPPYMEEYMMARMYGSPPFLQAIFDATAAARTVPPARPEIEFLHGWSAYHLREWTVYLDGNPAEPTERRWLSASDYWRPISDESVAFDALYRAAALAPHDPLFVEAARLIAERADLLHDDAMRRTFLLFDTGAGSCAESDCTEWTRRHDVVADAGAMPWRPWSAPSEMGHPLADVPGGPDLLRRFAADYHGDGESLQHVRTFPLAGGRFDGRMFWAVFDPSADTCRAHRRGVSIHVADCTAPVLAVYERRGSDWRAVTQRRVPMDVVSVVAPVDIEPSQAWIVTRGVNDRHMDANEPLWEVLRFDGEALLVEIVENWLDAMILDVDLDGALDILGSRARRLCSRCSVTRRAVRLYRWTGVRMVAAPLEFLSAGSASGAAVTANNRAVALARARRWAEAVVVVDAARALVAESPVFRRNASLIDLNADASGGVSLSDDTLLHHVFAGSWPEAVDLFRRAPVGPDLFAEPLPYIAAAGRSESRYGTPPFLRAIFDATAAARAVAPARAEIEFLHAWSAFHLDPDTTVASSTHWSDPDYRIDVDNAAVLEVFDRAAVLAPGDPLFIAVGRAVGDRGVREGRR